MRSTYFQLVRSLVAVDANHYGLVVLTIFPASQTLVNQVQSSNLRFAPRSERPRGGRRPLPSARGPRPHSPAARVDQAGSGAAGPGWLALAARPRQGRLPARLARPSRGHVGGDSWPAGGPDPSRRRAPHVVLLCSTHVFFFLLILRRSLSLTFLPCGARKEMLGRCGSETILFCARAAKKGRRVTFWCFLPCSRGY